MARLLRCSATVRTLALLLLVWIGLDVGLHGFVSSDYAAIPSAGRPAVVGTGSGTVRAHGTPDHCFCHSVSVGALTPLRPVFLAPVGEAETRPCPPPPHADRHPLDQPPRLTA